MAINFFRIFDRGLRHRSIFNNLSFRREANEDHDHYYGDTAKGYLAKRLKQESWHREQAIVQEMLATLPDGLRVLDVPFGTGRFVDMYMAKNMSIHGVDISADMLHAARETLGKKYDQCDVRQCSADALPYHDGYFDVSVCFRFFGLIPLDMAQRVLAELRRVTSGSLIIRVPVRKAGAPALPPANESEAVQGRLYEPELMGMFEKYGFRLYGQQLINEREHVQFVVYALTNRPCNESVG